MIRSCLLPLMILVSAPAQGQPAVTFTQVPPCGSGTVPLEGIVTGVSDAALYRIAPYIYTGAWWTKPTFAEPTLPLIPSGPGTATFSGNLVSHPTDKEAGYITAFLIPAEITPPQASGVPFLPHELFTYPHAEATRECAIRVLDAFDRAWLVKDSGGTPVGPGPNIFSGSPENVWVDAGGCLHLKLTKRAGKWRSAEIFDITADPARSSPGPGTYRFEVQGDLDGLDPNVVLGLFTWDTFAPQYNYRELDLEFARWGNPLDPTCGQFVVQPWDTPGNLQRFTVPPGDTLTTHEFTWNPDAVDFQSRLGPGTEGPVLSQFSYQGPDVPPPGNETANVRMNLWLSQGNPPLDGMETEIVIAGFEHSPPPATGIRNRAPRARNLRLSVHPSPTRSGVFIEVLGRERRDWTVEVFDLEGRRVRRLDAGPGPIRWDGSDQIGRQVGAGVYWIVVRDAREQAVRKILKTG